MSAPEATVLLGTHCPHCPAILHSLSELVKKGEISQLHAINIEAAPEVAQKYAVRSVPWVKIGDYILTGLQPLDALQQRIKWSDDKNVLLGEFDHMLSNGEVEQVTASINADNAQFDVIMTLLADPATILSTRIGIGVIMEDFENTDLIKSQLKEFTKLLDSSDSRVRADAAHYLSLTHSDGAIPSLKAHQDDKNSDVRAVIKDSIESLQE